MADCALVPALRDFSSWPAVAFEDAESRARGTHAWTHTWTRACSHCIFSLPWNEKIPTSSPDLHLSFRGIHCDHPHSSVVEVLSISVYTGMSSWMMELAHDSLADQATPSLRHFRCWTRRDTTPYLSDKTDIEKLRIYQSGHHLAAR